jgi:hypothetical protein
LAPGIGGRLPVRRGQPPCPTSACRRSLLEYRRALPAAVKEDLNVEIEHPIVAPAAAHELCARQRSNIGSRVTREGHARFLRAPEGESPSGGSTTSDEISGWPSLHRHSRYTLINRHSSGSVP